MECHTWENSTNTTVKVCLPWVDFCHAGHEVRSPKNPDLKMICSWGSNRFPHWPVNDKGNPLERVDEYRHLPSANWSILKSNIKQKPAGENNFRLHYRLQKDEEGDKSDHSSKEYKISFEAEFSLAEESEEEDKMSTSNFQQENEGGKETEHNPPQENHEEEKTVNENIYYDDVELKEKFEEDILNFNSKDFIVDLVLSLKYDWTHVKNNCPMLHKNRFYTYDESLWRYVHLYEQIILLAYGFWRPGLVNLLTTNGYFDQIYQTNERELNNNYSSFMCLVSLMQGDFEYFLRYCKGLLEALDVKQGSGSSYVQKAARLLMLCRGFSHYTEIDEISGVKEEYERMFRELFPKKYKTIMQLHKLATLNDDRLISLFTCKNISSQSFKIKRDKKLYTRLIEGLLVKSLELDNGSVEWVGSLTRVWMGDDSGLDYICKVYDISSSKINIYKDICSFDILAMTSLFDAIKEEILVELWKLIYGVLNGNPEAVCEIILRKIKDNMFNNNIVEDLSEAKIILIRLISNLFWLEESDYISKDVLTQVIW